MRPATALLGRGIAAGLLECCPGLVLATQLDQIAWRSGRQRVLTAVPIRLVGVG
jgi:hypothetical protein